MGDAALARNKNMKLLDVQSNHLEGNIPDDWSHATRLVYLTLQNNRFTGAAWGAICESVCACPRARACVCVCVRVCVYVSCAGAGGPRTLRPLVGVHFLPLSAF